MTRWALVVACGLSSLSFAQKLASDDPWAQPAMTKDALLQFIPRELDGIYKRMDPAKARELKALLAEVERQVQSPIDRVSYGTLNAAFLEGLGFSDEAKIHNGWAALQNPDSNVALANVGALNCYPPILKLAMELDPKSPVPPTNLASCAMSLEKWDIAKAAYEKALSLDPNHKPALIGMGQWYLHVPDLERAIPYFVKANGLVAQKFLDTVKDEKGKPPPPAKPIEPGPDNRFGGGAQPEEDVGSAHVTKNKLELPPLPRWGSPDAFIAAGSSRNKLAAFYGEKMSAGLKAAIDALKSDPLAKLKAERKRLQSLSPEEQNAAGVELSLKPKWDDSAVSRALQLNYAWADEKLRKADDAFAKAQDAYKKIGEQLAEVAEARNKKLAAVCPPDMGSWEQIDACRKGAESAFIESCKLSMTLNGKFFVTYRDAYARWYDEVKPVLEELYRVQGLWIRQISDPSLWDVAVKARDTNVFSPLSMRMVEENTMRLALAGVGMAAFGRSAEVCPKQPPPQSELAEEPEIPDVGKPEQKCPLPKNGLKIPPFDVPGIKVPFSFTVWCKEAEFKMSTGVAKNAAAVLSVKHRFGTDKSTTVYVGVEGSLKKTGPGGVDVGVKGELGASVTFKNGQVVDVGGTAGVSESISLPEGVGRASAGVTATIEKGAPDVSFKPSAGTKIPGL